MRPSVDGEVVEKLYKRNKKRKKRKWEFSFMSLKL